MITVSSVPGKLAEAVSPAAYEGLSNSNSCGLELYSCFCLRTSVTCAIHSLAWSRGSGDDFIRNICFRSIYIHV